MSEATLGVGVFGIGWVAGEHIKGYMANPKTEIRALASRRKQSAQAKKDELGLDCAIVDSLDDMLARDDIDIVSLCSPNFLRADEIIKCCEAGKHFFAEKPVVHSYEQLQDVKKAYKKADVKSIVGFVVEYYAQYLSIQSLIRSGGLGDVFYAETDYWHELGPWWHGWHAWKWGAYTLKGGASVALLGGCHAIGALLNIVKDDVVEVSAYGCRGHREEFEYLPTYTAALRFKNGGIGKTGGSFEIECPYHFNIIIHGSKGSVINEKYFSKELFGGQEDFQTFNCTLINSGEVSHHPFSSVINAFVDDIENNVNSRIDLDFGFKVHEVAIAIDRSIETGKPVTLPL